MSERHLKLLIKLIPFLTFLLLSQLGCEFKFQSTAQTTDTGTYSSGTLPALPVSSCGRYSRGCRSDFCSGRGYPYERISPTALLPSDEVKALGAFISKLGLTPVPSISRSFCSDKDSYATMAITCSCTYRSSSECHITDINMENLNLRGIIHQTVSNLTYLETLDLSHNELGGTIPDSLGSLFSLKFLDLSDNQLTGSIPRTLGNLRNLTALYLHMNFLSDNIPPTLGSLSSLEYLYLHFNLLNGRIPNDLGSLAELISLRLDDNQLSGPLPEELSRLSNLQQLWLTSNKLTERVPESYNQLRGLSSFGIGGNNLSGPIPKFIQNWTNLTTLILLGNNFDGYLPKEIFEMKNLETLWVSDLNTSGFPFPESANLTKIFSLTLRNCSISGSIPTYIGNWSSLRYLDLSFNNLTGEIPDSIGNLKLIKMYLSRNMLSGRIHAPWFPKHDRAIVDLSYNNFTYTQPPKGKKDTSFPQQKKQSVNLYACCSNTALEMISPIFSPISIRKKYCPHGKSKDRSLFINCGGEATTIEGNHYDADNYKLAFHESSKGNWGYSCSGDFISSTANSSDYIKNMTCGVYIPEAPLYAKARLCPVSLTYYGFCLRKGNYSVRLHFAETVYTEDATYSSLGKRVFDVYIQGERVLKDFNIKENARGPNKAWTENFYASVVDDPLVIHFLWAGKGSIYIPPALNGALISAISVTHVRGGKLSPSHIAMITVASVITPLLLLALVWKMGWLRNKELDEKFINLQGRSVTLNQLIDATGKFSPKKEIGKSSFAKVYEAKFKDPDQSVAVKKFFSQSKQAIDEITSQLLALTSLRHENVVQLLDGYSGKDLHLLVYEYMEHKSLDRALFGSKPFLDWDARFNICKGIAKGLKYLHERVQQRLEIVHGNIKASNILLDQALNAKVSDFGLAKLYDEKGQFEAIRERATRAYMAPEYATRRIKTEKADVYSFGVVLLEIVSGRSSAASEEKWESDFLMDEACNLDKNERLVELVDKNLNKYDEEQAKKILKLAMMCINPSPDLRPTMSEVVSVLQGEKTIQLISKAVTPSSVLWQINDISDPQVKVIGEFAVSEYDKESKANLKFESVVQGESGTNYRLIVVAKDGETTNNYEAVVWEKPREEHSKTLTSFEPVKG